MKKRKNNKQLHPTTAYAQAVVDGEILTGRMVRLACARHLHDLRTAHKRGLRFDEDLANHVLNFFPAFLKHTEGLFADQPFELSPHQKFIVGSLFGWVKADGYRRFRHCYLEESKGSGKALALDTPIPTPSGWTTMGQIRIGDVVFDEHGEACNVLKVSEVMHDHECFRVSFDDGNSIVADAEHLWLTEARCGGRGGHGATQRGVKKADWRRWQRIAIRNTAQISATLRYPNGKYQSANHSVALSRPLNLPDSDLLVEPYALGAWLGDGDSDCARITIGEQDAAEMSENLVAVGVAVGDRQGSPIRAGRYRLGAIDFKEQCRRGHIRQLNGSQCRACEREVSRARRHKTEIPGYTVFTMNERLRVAGLLNHKHIPESYLRASIGQRMALLEGLMDSDGHIQKNGHCEFSNTNKRLVEDVCELIISLGFKAAVSEGRARLNGKDCGPKYRIHFSPPGDVPVFRLTRKKAQQRFRHNRRRLAGDRRIVDCLPAPSVPVRCIAVDSPSHLYLAGKGMIPTHNTPLGAGMLIYGLVMDGEEGAEIFCAAVTRDQAGLAFRDCKHMAEKSAFADRLDITEHNIAYEETNSFIRPVSSEARSLDGKRVFMCMLDEVHEHRTPLVIDKMVAGNKGRRQPLNIRTTNSGYDRTSVCWYEHEYSREVLEEIRQDDDWFAYVCQLDTCGKCLAEGKSSVQDDCEECDHWWDEKVWQKVNPNLGVSVTYEYLRGEVLKAQAMPSKQMLVKRLNFCIWTDGYASWLPMDDWDLCRGMIPGNQLPEFLRGKKCFAGLDLADTTDTAALVLIFPVDDVFYILPKIWIPQNMRKRTGQERTRFEQWVSSGFVTATPGDLIDYSFILDCIAQCQKQYDLKMLAFDRHGASTIVQWLCDKQNFTTDEKEAQTYHKPVLVEFGQGFASMSAPTKEFANLVLSHRFVHAGHPVLRWMVSNVVIDTDPAGNQKPNKGKSTEKIDAAVAAIMALDCAVRNANTGQSVYDDHGIRTL